MKQKYDRHSQIHQQHINISRVKQAPNNFLLRYNKPQKYNTDEDKRRARISNGEDT